MPESFGQSYYQATAVGQKQRPPLEFDQTVDVCIIGAGYTGLSCALATASAGLKTLVLEAETAGFGASGRNGGQLITGQRVDQIELVRKYGRIHAQQLWDVALEARALVSELVNRNAIACDVKHGHITAAVDNAHAKELESYVEHLRKYYNYTSAEYVSERAMPELVATPNYRGGMYDRGALHLHPLNFALGLAIAAEKAGAIIKENSRVMSTAHGGKAEARTAKATAKANFLVYACDGYLESLNRKLAAFIIPISNYIAATESLGAERARRLIPSGAAIADTKFVLDYYRMSADHRLIFGGGETYGAEDARDPAVFVRPCISRVFPELRDVGIEFAWGGRLAITAPRLPHVGRLEPNVYFAQGYSGQGVAIATQVGKLIGDLIGGQSSKFDIYERLRIPKLPGGAMFSRPLSKLALTWYALRDRLG